MTWSRETKFPMGRSRSRERLRAVHWTVLPALLIFLFGCSTAEKKGNTTAQASSPIDGLVLLSAAAAVDTHPPMGADAIAVIIYPRSHSKPKALAITSGTLEVLMFDGVINEQTSTNVKPLKVWSLLPGELKIYANKTAIGMSYPLTLLWGNEVPKQDNITIIARYLDPSGRTVYSSPSTISVGDRRSP